MKNIKYEEIVSKYKPREHRIFNGIIAFISGGILGSFGQYLAECYASWFNIPTKDGVALVLLTYIFLASLLTALGVFDNMVNFCRCGLIIPITGFAHSMTSSALEYRNEGPIFGTGNNIFKLAGSVILYGIVSAFFFAIIRYLIFGGLI